MISIQTGMLVALGFFLASLVWLLLASAFWSRAVRLTTERLKRSMPVSEAEIKADRDRLRAEYAIRVHRLETSLEQARLERARQLIEINRRDASISALETDVVTIRAELEENQNARRVLEQTVADRLPKVEARLTEAKRILFNRDREIAELTQGAKRQKQALEEASQKAAQIDQLKRGGRRAAGEPQAEAALRAEIEALRAKGREQAALVDRLQRRLGPLAPGQAATADGDDAHANLSEAEAALEEARNPPPLAAAGPSDRERDLRALAARAEDQAGEIAKLKAALAAFEQGDGGAANDSKLALRARAGSAEAQAERQAATISRLRAELAAANERLTRQASQFMDEVNRFVADAPSSGHPAAGRDGRRKLVDRVAQVRPTISGDTARSAAASADGADRPNGPKNGNGAGTAGGTETAGQASAPGPREPGPREPGPQEPGPQLAVPPAAAEMPQTAPIPEQRKSRLLDRITGLAKT